MAIITVSHQLGSGGAEIAHDLAERLGYRSVGGEMLAEAAHRHGLVEERLSRLGEAKPAFLDRLAAETQTYIAVMQSAIYDAARRDDVVLLGRGGQWLLRDVPHVLRIRVIAPFDVRVRRLAEAFTRGPGGTPGVPASQDAVGDLVRRDDADKRGRMRYLYDRDIDDPRLYDLMVNTERGDLQDAIEPIVALARRSRFATTAGGARTVANRATAAHVLVALMTDEATRHFRHERADADGGTVSVVTAAPPEMVERVGRTVEGVSEVRIVEVPIVPPIPLL